MMRALSHPRAGGALVGAGAWIAVAFLVLLFELVLAVLTVPHLATPMQRFRGRRQCALDWEHNLTRTAGT